MYRVLGSDQKVYGPITIEQLRQWQAEGRVNGTTMVLAEGSAEWKPLANVSEFSIPPVIVLAPAVKRSGISLGALSLTFGVLANVPCCGMGILALPGIVLSLMTLCGRDPYPYSSSRGMAIGGLVLSLLSLTWLVILLIALAMGSGGYHFHHHLRQHWL